MNIANFKQNLKLQKEYESPEIEFISFEPDKNLMLEFFTTHPNEGGGDVVYYGESQTLPEDDDL